MTTTLSVKGQVIIPHDLRVKLGLHPGDDFIVLSPSTGEIVLKPIRRPRKKFADALRGLQGLDVERIDEPVRDTGL